jgi:acetoin utilization deacetylase AcuC-like enzyme
MEKYRLLRKRLANVALLELEVPQPVTRVALERVHDRAYVDRVFEGRLTPDEVRKIGFPWSPSLVERSRRSVGGTVSAAATALEEGIAANLAGGTHHAFSDRGTGFCVFNDVAVATRAMQAERHAERVAVIDVDVHQGDGTAALFSRDPTVFTLSIHGANNFPFHKKRSDLDIGLPDGAGDDQYLSAVEGGLREALSIRPDLTFFVAGADPFEGARLGRLSVSKAGIAERDELVLNRCSAAGTCVVIVMSGGYASDMLDTVDIHETTIRTASKKGTDFLISAQRTSLA